MFNCFFSLFCLLLFALTPVVAQNSLRGNVQDPQGKAIDGARLVLYRQGASTALATQWSANGEFVFAAAKPGKYLLQVSADGFRQASLLVDGDQILSIRLQLDGVDQRLFVTAEGAAQTIDQVSKAASVIAAEELNQRNEYSLAEALRDTPGVLVRNLGGPGQSTSIRIRGLRADATAVLIDGLRFRDVATTQGDASSFLSTLNVINLDRVEVLRGSGSSLYGSNAVGGTVNLVTDSGGGARHGGLQVEGGSLGLIRSRATVAGGILSNKLTYSAGLLHLNVLSGVDGDDRARSTGLQTFTRYTLGVRSSISGRFLASDDFVQPNLSPTATGIPAANIPASTIVRAIPLAPEQLLRSAAGLPIAAGDATFIPNRNDPDNRRASRFWSGALIYSLSVLPTAEWTSSFQRVHTNRFFRNGPAGAGSQPAVSNVSQFRGDIDSADSKISWRAKPWLGLTGGYEFERETYLNLDDNRLPAPSTVSTRTQAGQRSNSVYFANQLTLAQQRLQISLSGRAQTFQLDRPVFLYSGTSNVYGGGAVISPPRARVGDVAISYFLPSSGTKLRAHGGNSYRAPALYERYGSGFFFSPVTNSVAFTPFGDPRLSPDRYNSLDAGVDQYLFRDKVRLSGTWFYSRIVQITQFDSSSNIVRPATDLFSRTSGYYNGAGGTSRGLELTAELRPSRSTLFRGSYSYVNADTNQDTAVRGFWRALSVPAHSFTALFNQRIAKRNDLTVDLYHSSDYYNALSAGGRARAYLYGGATKIDIVFNREIRQRESYTLKGYVKVDNLLNQRYFDNGFQASKATMLSGIQILFK